MYLANKKPKNFEQEAIAIVSCFLRKYIAMINSNCCFIRRKYFESHPELLKILDPNDPVKQSHRSYVFIEIAVDSNHYYILLRNNLGDEIRPYGRIGHAVPSQKRPFAGLDFRHALLINDPSYIEPHTTQKLPDSQYKIITDDYGKIQKEFEAYVRKYKKVAQKGRISREALFRDSSLVNYHEQLGL